ncbi:MAG TPA: hypothetical protein PKJ17_10265, partial [Syntrophorhabdaceae bacterium]|nr:hypothetical protein [Syntrophorhabdaceae bacterium]
MDLNVAIVAPQTFFEVVDIIPVSPLDLAVTLPARNEDRFFLFKDVPVETAGDPVARNASDISVYGLPMEGREFFAVMAINTVYSRARGRTRDRQGGEKKSEKNSFCCPGRANSPHRYLLPHSIFNGA